MKKLMEIPWGAVNLSDHGVEFDLEGNKTVSLQARESEIQISFSTTESDSQNSRFVTGTGHTVHINPALPDLPVVIKPLSPLSIMPGKTLNAVIDVPMVLQIQWGPVKKQQLLFEFPFQDLSRSWFGDPDSGEVAYFLESPFHSDYLKYEENNHCISCPVTIINKSSQTLKLERMILRVPFLPVYKGESRFFSGGTKITFRGQDQISQLSFSKNAPHMDEALSLFTPARRVEDSSMISKSFYFIKTLYEG
jgi:hypothetical protein